MSSSPFELYSAAVPEVTGNVPDTGGIPLPLRNSSVVELGVIPLTGIVVGVVGAVPEEPTVELVELPGPLVCGVITVVFEGDSDPRPTYRESRESSSPSGSQQ